MADSKITALTSISTSTDPAVDPLVIVDVSDTSMAATGTTKKVTLNNLLSSSPTATGNFTITGDLTVDTSTLKVDSTNNRVGVGTATPTGIFHAANLGTAGTTADNFNGYFSSANRNSNVYILAKNTEGSNLYLGDGDSNTVGAIIYDHTSNYMRFDVNGAEVARFNSTGNLAFPTGKGIDFSAVTGGTGTATANVLNDYEEGTWTPTIIGTTTAGVGVYVSQIARYTKVGNLVTVQCYIDWSAHTGTGDMRLNGLPFTSSSDASTHSAVTFGFVQNLALTAGNILTGWTNVGTSNFNFYQYATGGGTTTAVPIDSSAAVIFTLSYRV